MLQVCPSVHLREADCSLPAYEAASINSGPQAWAPSLGEGDRSAATPISCQRPTPRAAQGVWICSGLHRDLFIQVHGAEHRGGGGGRSIGEGAVAVALSVAWWPTSAISAPGRLRQGHLELEASLTNHSGAFPRALQKLAPLFYPFCAPR